jgi:rubrerythrin
MANVIEKAEDYLSTATISREVLRDKLSEFLAVEKGGLKLYEQALRIVSDSDLRKKFSEFRDQTRKHETILISVIHELGMDPAYLSAGAKLATEKADALLKTMRDGLSAKSAEINAVENIILAETKDRADWALLGKVARQTNDSRIRDVLKDAVSEVEPEEDEHLNWTRDQMTRLEINAIAIERK